MVTLLLSVVGLLSLALWVALMFGPLHVLLFIGVVLLLLAAVRDRNRQPVKPEEVKRP